LILATGGGFIGQAIATRLGSEVLLLRRSGDGAGIVFDLCETSAVGTLVQTLKDKHITRIIHTAAVTPWGQHPDYEQDIAMAKTVSILCNELRVPSLINMSGWNVYDMTKGEPPFSEDTPLLPDTDYGLSKLSVERYFEQNLQTTRLVSARLSSVYGPGQTSAGLIPNIVQSALKQGVITLNSTSTRRDYLYIDDLVTAVKMIEDKELTTNTAVNIGSGATVSVAECAQLIAEICHEINGSKVEIIAPENPTDSVLPNNQLSIAKAQSMGLLGEVTPFKEGLKEYVQWYMNQ
jgi:UDP-glucose 4-epimerase